MTRHPGGLRLTERAVRLAELQSGAKILDVGCGDGDSAEFLRARGFAAVGIAENAENLPFADAEFDCVMFECVLSVVDDAPRALSEARRVLAPNGKLIVSDVFAGDAGALRRSMEGAGFAVLHEEDHTPALVTYAAERGFAAGKGHGYVLFVCRK
ncbi:MAG: methyltransferase domain-containing protein [Oscillospiraceae bacterium]|nr:methyltransferase domain-containing protein [Oscillospiraceae bacterium]